MVELITSENKKYMTFKKIDPAEIIEREDLNNVEISDALFKD